LSKYHLKWLSFLNIKALLPTIHKFFLMNRSSIQ
jgi:hypothetical protein